MNLLLLSYADGVFVETLGEELRDASDFADVQLCFAGKKAREKYPARSPEALAETIKEETLVLPLFMTAGAVYKRAKAALEKSGRVRFFPPLLETAAGREALVRALTEIYGFKDFEKYILVAHGSEEGNGPLFSLQEDFFRAGIENVKIAFLHGTPELEQMLSDSGEKTAVIPLLFMPGHHSEKDIFSRLPERITPIGKGLLESPRFRQIFIDYQ